MTTNQIATVSTSANIAGLTHLPANNANLKVVPGNFGEACALNTGAKFILIDGDTEREVTLVKLDVASPQVEVEGRKLHSVIVTVEGEEATITVAPATMIALMNNTDPTIGKPVGRVTLPSAPLAATKAPKVKAEKGPKAPSKRDLCRTIFIDANTRARLLEQPALARKDMIALFGGVLAGMQMTGQHTYYNNLKNEVFSHEQMVESENRVRTALAEEGIAIPGEDVLAAEPTDDEIAASMAAGDEVAEVDDAEEIAGDVAASELNDAE